MDSKKEYLLHLLIINRSGSLLYNKQFLSDDAQTTKIDSNDILMLAGTFHALHTISAHALPPPQDITTTSSSTTTTTSSTTSSTTTTNLNSSQQQSQPLNSNSIPLQPSTTSLPTTTTTTESILSFHNQNNINTLLHPEKQPIQQTLGISVIETKHFKLHCLQTPTGLKIILLTTPNYPDVTTALRNINIGYVDYVLKNPFYELGMPIRSDLFETHLTKVLIPSLTPKH